MSDTKEILVEVCVCGHHKTDHTPDPVRDYRAEPCDLCDCADYRPDLDLQP